MPATPSERFTVQPPCPYFGECGGCQLQHWSYAGQLKEKESWLKNLAKGLVSEEKIRPIFPSPKEYGYRSRVQFQVNPRGEVGFYALNSQRVVPIERCLIAEDAINQAIPQARKMALELVKSRRRPSLLKLEVTVDSAGRVEIAAGEEERSFLQVNAGANAKLIEFLGEMLRGLVPRRVLELYAGEGNLSAALTPGIPDWVAVESNPAAVKKARERRSSVRWLQGDAGKVLKKLMQQRETFDLALLDPPRRGAGDCLPMLAKMDIPHLLYISCHAPALMTDLKRLMKDGYEIEWIQPIDFFPQVLQLESIVLCSRSNR